MHLAPKYPYQGEHGFEHLFTSFVATIIVVKKCYHTSVI